VVARAAAVSHTRLTPARGDATVRRQGQPPCAPALRSAVNGSLTPLHGLPLASWYFDHIGHPEDGPYWQAPDMTTRYAEVDVPMLHVAGWFDVFLGGQLRAFQGLQAHARSEPARQAQRLIVGPWVHGPANTSQTQAGDVDFGPDAVFDLRAQRLRWYDYWLKGVANGALDGPPVRAFLMGANRWLELDSWPPDGITYRPLFSPLKRGAVSHRTGCRSGTG
jgi:uncharacterized protein